MQDGNGTEFYMLQEKEIVELVIGRELEKNEFENLWRDNTFRYKN